MDSIRAAATDLLAELGPFDGEPPEPDSEPWDYLAQPGAAPRFTHLLPGARQLGRRLDTEDPRGRVDLAHRPGPVLPSTRPVRLNARGHRAFSGSTMAGCAIV